MTSEITPTVDGTVTPAPASQESLGSWGARSDEVRAALTVVVALLAVGVVLGLLWAWWSPDGPPGGVLKAGTIQINESETFAAADGRFAVLTVAVGVIAGISLWFARSVRGPLIALALAVGGFLAAEVTAEVGHLVGGGTNHAKVGSLIPHLPLSVHLSGLLMFEGAAAVLIYSVIAAFAVHDDLGRPDPTRDALRPPVTVAGYQPQFASPASVPVEAGLEQPTGQHAGLDGDAAGLPQQHDLPPQ